MKIADFIESIGYTTITVLITAPIGSADFDMDIDHVVEDDDYIYLEDILGNSLKIDKKAEISYINDEFIVTYENCKYCIKLNE